MMAELQVSVPATVKEGDEIVVYGDWGSSLGPTPERMTPGPTPAYPRTRRARSQPGLVGWHRAPWHQAAWHGMPMGAGGWHRARWHEEEWRRPRPVMSVRLKEVYGYGPLTVAVKPANSLGQEDAGAPGAQTIFFVEAPLPLEAAGFADYNAGDGTVGFTLTHATLMES